MPATISRFEPHPQRRIPAAVAIALLAGLAACGGGSPTGPDSSGITAIAMEAPDRMVEGSTATLSATLTTHGTIRPADSISVRWSVRPTNAATISPAGVLSARIPGTLEVQVSALERPTLIVTRTVVVDSAAIVSIALQPVTNIVPGDTIRPQTAARDALGRNRLVPAVVSLVEGVFAPAGPGAFRATGEGTARFRATLGALTSEVSIVVGIGNIQRLGVPPAQELSTGDSRTLAVSGQDRRGNLIPVPPTLAALSRDPAIVSVSVVGDSVRLTALTPGQTRVVVARAAIVDSFTVTTVGPALTGLVITPSASVLDWVTGVGVRVEARNTLGALTDVTSAVTVSQAEGEPGLVGWQFTGGATGRLSAGLPPFQTNGVRRDVGASARVVFAFQALRDTLVIPMNYRRPRTQTGLPPSAFTMTEGDNRTYTFGMADSTGTPLEAHEILGVLAAPTSSNPAVVSVSANGTITAVSSGTSLVRRQYLEGTQSVQLQSQSAVTVQPVVPVPLDSSPIGTGYVQVRPVEGLTPTQRAAILQAVTRVENVVGATALNPFLVNAPASLCISGTPAISNETLSGIVIQMSLRTIDGFGGVLGAAGWCGRRSGAAGLPVLGVMMLDVVDADVAIANGSFNNIVTHELLHVLGVGTLWTQFGYAPAAPLPPDPQYTGTGGVSEYALLGGAGSVPVENVGGAGTAGAHWRESVFKSELMTGFLSGATSPMSRLTVASLGDLGYTVNMNAAESYTLGATLMALSSAQPAAQIKEQLIPGRFTVDRTGKMMPIKPQVQH